MGIYRQLLKLNKPETVAVRTDLKEDGRGSSALKKDSAELADLEDGRSGGRSLEPRNHWFPEAVGVGPPPRGPSCVFHTRIL